MKLAQLGINRKRRCAGEEKKIDISILKALIFWNGSPGLRLPTTTTVDMVWVTNNCVLA
jgi:ABC-type Co2+ transport system permease subunit